MTLKWKLFGIANYILLLVYGFLLVGMFNFSVEEVLPREKTSPLLLLLFSFFIIILNSILNLYIFHFRLPDKPIVRIKRFYTVSTTLYILCILVVLVSIVKDMKYEIDEYGADDTTYIILGFAIFISIVGFFVATNQFFIAKYIEGNSVPCEKEEDSAV